MLLTVTDPDEAASELIALAIAGGGPDNITCIVADVVSGTRDAATSAGRPPPTVPGQATSTEPFPIPG